MKRHLVVVPDLNSARCSFKVIQKDKFVSGFFLRQKDLNYLVLHACEGIKSVLG